jgi:SAM-dependent methyltransferase
MLDPKAFRRFDETPDDLFYVEPRFVEHIDEAAIADLEQLYREQLPAGGEILDLMSSWVSHLPGDVSYARVAGLGMNRAELAGNARLSDFVVHNLNAEPILPFPNVSFDAAIIGVSIQYLVDPIAVLRDLARVVRPDGPLVIAFSNRCFPTKAVAIWQSLDDEGHIALVTHYLDSAGWHNITSVRRVDRPGDPLYAVIATSPAEH